MGSESLILAFHGVKLPFGINNTDNRTPIYSGDGSTYYIEVPDTFIPIGNSIISPLFLAAEYHYQVTNTAGNQSITPISAAEFATIAPSLSDNGDERQKDRHCDKKTQETQKAILLRLRLF